MELREPTLGLRSLEIKKKKQTSLIVFDFTGNKLKDMKCIEATEECHRV